ncbi:MAG: YbaB/EbfC family nucleoid-associated protein [Treponema sp.]|nr:YbaB/EbfC family nucleoid-associated protein [Treponema sp.]
MNINPFDMMKNAQKIREQFDSFQEKLETISVTGASGAGMVEVDLDGKLEVTAVRIAPEVMEGGDVEMLQDMIMAAFSDGMRKVKEAVSTEARTMTGGLDIPGLSGLTGVL